MGSEKENTKQSENAENLQDKPMTGHNYDGIGELDNPPPRWIMALFYLTIGFSILYGAYYFWLGIGKNQTEEYTAKSAQHDEKYKEMNKPSSRLMLLTDKTSLSEGKAVFTQMACLACHGANGEGNAIGPNLTDEYWIKGCDFPAIFETIKNGRSEKGMTGFKGKISDEKIAKVASFVLVTLKDTKPANARAPQGTICK